MRPSALAWFFFTCILILISIAMSGCSTPPIVVTKTVTETVDVPGPVQKVPAALSADCPPAPLAGTTLGALVDRLSSVETALARCRIQLGQIRALK